MLKFSRKPLASGWRHFVAIALAAIALVIAVPGYVMAQQGAGVYAMADLLPEGVTEGVPASGPYGTATFERTAGGGTRVTVIVLRLEPGSTHANHVHDGSCTGAILHPLEPLQAGNDGTATAVTELTQEVEFQRWYVNVHAGAELPSPGIVCGKVNPAVAGGGVPPIIGATAQPTGVPAPTAMPPSAPPTTGEAGQTGVIPGMPVTGGQRGESAIWLLLTGTGAAAATVAAGLVLRRRARRNG
jgi:hypothetical protein